MGKVTGFKEFERKDEAYKPVEERVKHYKEFTVPLDDKEITELRYANMLKKSEFFWQVSIEVLVMCWGLALVRLLHFVLAQVSLFFWVLPLQAYL